MELTNRRFAIFLASGLTLAVVVGLLVWKVSDAGVSLNGQETEFAGQPVAVADASSQEQTEQEPSSAADTTSSELAAGNENADMSGNNNDGNGGAGNVNDPLAPPNANLGGGRGGSVETSYYRPTNAAPAPTAAQQQNQQQPQPARTTAPQQTQQPDSTDTSAKPSESPSTTTATPGEPQRPVPDVQEGGRPPESTRTPAEPQAGSEEIELDIADEAIRAGKAAAGALGITSDDGQAAKQDAPKKRPEDPFSASARVQQAPAENKTDKQVTTTGGAEQADAQPAEGSAE